MMNREEYSQYIAERNPRTSEWRTLSMAFLVGGVICMIGQGFYDLYKYLLPQMENAHISALMSMTMIFLASFFTGIGLYDRLGKHAGAGSIIPITGFANSIVSPAMEFRREGIIFGTMANMFAVAGPVIVTGVCASVLIGVIYFIVGLF